MSTMIGRTISHYRIIEKVGSGGMGVVYKAEDTALHRFVALKFLPVELTRDPQAKERFVAEARAASAIDHPNICTIHEIGETDDGQLFICMTHYAGESLRRKIRDGRLGVAETLKIGLAVGRGLVKAHEQGIVHRDVKPANIVFTDDGQAKVVDFGLAMLAGGDHPAAAGTTAGTAAYMSPEQARGGAVDARTDVWSLGAVLYEMLAGVPPFRGEHEQAIVHAILTVDPPRLADLRDDVPVELEAAIERALEKQPARRHAGMPELVEDLEEVARAIEAGRLRRPLVRMRRRTRRRLLATLFAVLAAAVAGGAAFWRWSATRSAPATIAVFTFAPTSTDTWTHEFTGGLRDVLVADLTKISRLRVKTVEHPPGGSATVREVAQSLDADYVLDGSVLRVGDAVRVTAFLSDGRSDEQLWSGIYQKGRDDVMAVQGEITREVVENIRVEVTPEEKALLGATMSAVPAAYEAGLKGAFYAKKMTVQNVRRALEQYTLAVEADPSYAAAWSGIAGAWLALGSAELGAVEPSEAARRATEAARRAIALNRLLGDPHRALGQAARDFDGDFATADAEFAVALERNPRDAETLAQVALLRIAQGRFDDARRSVDEAMAIDPLATWFATVAAFAAACERRWDDAEAELRAALEFNDLFAPAYAERGRALLMQGRYADAAVALQRAIDLAGEPVPILEARLAHARARSGDAAAARSMLEQLTDRARTAYVPAAAFAIVHTGLGETAEALRWLDKAVEERAPQLAFLAVNPEWTSLRDDDRFTALAEKVKARR